MNNAHSTISLTRRRAAFAYTEVSGWEKAPWKDLALKSIPGLPIDIRTQGLCVTLATLMKGDFHENIIADLMGRWVLDASPRNPISRQENNEKRMSPGHALLKACVTGNRYDYMAAQLEAYAISEQVKLFANALYGK